MWFSLWICHDWQCGEKRMLPQGAAGCLCCSIIESRRHNCIFIMKREMQSRGEGCAFCRALCFFPS